MFQFQKDMVAKTAKLIPVSGMSETEMLRHNKRKFDNDKIRMHAELKSLMEQGFLYAERRQPEEKEVCYYYGARYLEAKYPAQKHVFTAEEFTKLRRLVTEEYYRIGPNTPIDLIAFCRHWPQTLTVRLCAYAFKNVIRLPYVPSKTWGRSSTTLMSAQFFARPFYKDNYYWTLPDTENTESISSSSVSDQGSDDNNNNDSDEDNTSQCSFAEHASTSTSPPSEEESNSEVEENSNNNNTDDLASPVNRPAVFDTEINYLLHRYPIPDMNLEYDCLARIVLHCPHTRDPMEISESGKVPYSISMISKVLLSFDWMCKSLAYDAKGRDKEAGAASSLSTFVFSPLILHPLSTFAFSKPSSF